MNQAIHRTLVSTEDQLRRYVETSDKMWASMVKRLSNLPSAGAISDEQVWTFLVVSAYASGGAEGIARLNGMLTGGQITDSSCPVWFEALPMSPRMGESNTNLDLAAGGVERRGGTSNGIEYSPSATWVVFVEAKWFSDLSTKVSNEQERNQLGRVIENALTFQSAEGMPTDCFVVLLTPRRFRDREFGSRLYWYKYHEYASNKNALRADLALVDETLPIRNQKTWSYPLIEARVDQLHLLWLSYEELMAGAPDTPLASAAVSLFTERAS